MMKIEHNLLTYMSVPPFNGTIPPGMCPAIAPDTAAAAAAANDWARIAAWWFCWYPFGSWCPYCALHGKGGGGRGRGGEGGRRGGGGGGGQGGASWARGRGTDRKGQCFGLQQGDERND